MPKHVVTVVVDLREHICTELQRWAHARGISIEEAVRYIIGEFFAMAEDTRLCRGTQLTGVSRGAVEGTEIDQECQEYRGVLEEAHRKAEEIQRKHAQIVASQGAASCKSCLKKLTSAEILEGKCSSCGADV